MGGLHMLSDAFLPFRKICFACSLVFRNGKCLSRIPSVDENGRERSGQTNLNKRNTFANHF